MIVRDPQTGRGMGINLEGYGRVASVCRSDQAHANLVHETAYSAVVSVTPTGAGDCFFYILNNDAEELFIDSITFRTASAESIQVKLGDSGTVGGTHAALVPVNRNAGSGKTADVTCEVGVDITGLSGGSIVDTVYGDTSMLKHHWGSAIILPKNSLLSIYAVTGAVALAGTLGFHFNA